jgi:diguanylate cyclase (GGDEF)-like protein
MPRPSRRRPPFGKRPPIWIAAILAALLLCALIDSREDADADFSLFYAAAVSAAGWWLGRRYAGVAAVLAAAGWIYADIERRPPGQMRFTVWNGFTRLAIFLAVGLLTARVRSDTRRLRRSRRVLEEESLRARTDPTTELPNAAGFLEQLDRELSDARRRGGSFSLACIEIEGLERYRDRHESSSVDELVKAIAAVLRRAVRASDFPARLDRDEFGIAFWDVEKDVLEKTLRRVLSGVEALGTRDPSTPLAARVGLVCFENPPDDPRELLRHGEKVLHEAHAMDQMLLIRDGEPEIATPASRGSLAHPGGRSADPARRS